MLWTATFPLNKMQAHWNISLSSFICMIKWEYCTRKDNQFWQNASDISQEGGWCESRDLHFTCQPSISHQMALCQHTQIRGGPKAAGPQLQCTNKPHSVLQHLQDCPGSVTGKAKQRWKRCGKPSFKRPSRQKRGCDPKERIDQDSGHNLGLQIPVRKSQPTCETHHH